jgi:hypothetical protein
VLRRPGSSRCWRTESMPGGWVDFARPELTHKRLHRATWPGVMQVPCAARLVSSRGIPYRTRVGVWPAARDQRILWLDASDSRVRDGGGAAAPSEFPCEADDECEGAGAGECAHRTGEQWRRGASLHGLRLSTPVVAHKELATSGGFGGRVDEEPHHRGVTWRNANRSAGALVRAPRDVVRGFVRLFRGVQARRYRTRYPR